MSEALQIRPAPVRKTVQVKAPPQHCFEVFTGGMGRWWPPSHTTSASALKDVTVEPRQGGRWYSSNADGSQSEWGKVLAWEPPARVLLAWKLNGDWQYDPDFETEVELTFTPGADGSTTVVLEHRNLERYGEKTSAVRDALDSPGGWGGILAEYVRVTEGG